jgi:hypothetical protein
MKVHNVFYIDLLLPYKETDTYGPAYARPPPDLISEEEEYKVKTILDTRIIGYGRGCKRQYKVH